MHEATLKLTGVEARPRPPRHAHAAATTSPWPTRPPAAPTTPSRCTRRPSSYGSRSSAPTTPTRSISRNNLAVAYQAAGRTDEAIKMHEATLKQQESKLGPDHPDTLTSRNNLAAAYHRRRPHRRSHQDA